MEYDVLKWFLDNPFFTLFGAVTLVQIAPIKINPWSMLAKWLKRVIGITALSDKLDKLAARVDEREAVSVRMRILRFSDECRHGEQHSKEHFDQIMSDITFYEKYCEKHPDFRNGITVASTHLISAEYEKKLRDGGWLE